MRRFPPMPIGFVPRVAALYAALFALAGIHLPFFPVWLKAKGLDPAGIGLVLAVPMVVRIFAISTASRIADRRDALRATLIVLTIAAIAGYALVGLADGLAAILVAYAIAACAFTPVMSLSETYALKGLGQRGRAYGPVRLWGSATFILGTFAGGFAADLIPARDLIWMIVAASVLIALSALALGAAVACRSAHERAAGETPRPVARSGVHRGAGGGKPDPGQPRGVLRLLGAAMARRRTRRHHDRRPVGAGRCGRDGAVRAARQTAAVFPAERAADDRRCRRRLALGRHGASIRRRLRCPGCNCCTRCRSARRIWAPSALSRATRRRGRARPRKAIWRLRSAWHGRRHGSIGRAGGSLSARALTPRWR